MNYVIKIHEYNCGNCGSKFFTLTKIYECPICKNKVRRRETEVRVFKRLDEYKNEIMRFKSEFHHRVINGRSVWFVDRVSELKSMWRSRVKEY
ncbi:MAG: hypothetical protein QE164_07645 [Candidatus Nezhaarchaeota archaeon]|nr:hypothetical protein [Candidatus Nezhaarchaeota archaeon]